jgi:hypothetical protein
MHSLTARPNVTDSLAHVTLSWFQWSSICISLILHQLSLSHPQVLQQQAVVSRLQPISISFLSLSVSTTISDLTILEFTFGTTKLRKQLYKNLKYDT